MAQWRTFLVAIPVLAGCGWYISDLNIDLFFGIDFISGFVISQKALHKLYLVPDLIVVLGDSNYCHLLKEHPYAIAMFMAQTCTAADVPQTRADLESGAIINCPATLQKPADGPANSPHLTITFALPQYKTDPGFCLDLAIAFPVAQKLRNAISDKREPNSSLTVPHALSIF